MDIQTFIQNFREAFGEKAELPLVFWYSDTQEGTAEKINGCIFKGMKTAREGGIISLNAETIGCGGGKFYTGFTEMPEHVPTFVSLKERYKQTPQWSSTLYSKSEYSKQKRNTFICAYRQDRKSERSGRCRIHSQPRYAFRTYHMGLL